MAVFDEYARYYELLYRDKNYVAEARFVKGLIDRHAGGARTLLDLGCGGGKHAAAFAEAGISVQGVDCSPGMLERARRLAGTLPPETAGRLAWTEGDIRSVRLDRSFDAVVSLFHVMSYLRTDRDLQQAFSTAAAHLGENGLFIFDCWYGPTVLTEPPEVRVKRMADESIAVTRLCEPCLLSGENSVLCAYTVFVEDKATGKIVRVTEEHRMRYLFRLEVERFFSGAGMVMVECGEWLTGRAPGTDTFGVYFVGRKTPAVRGA